MTKTHLSKQRAALLLLEGSTELLPNCPCDLRRGGTLADDMGRGNASALGAAEAEAEVEEIRNFWQGSFGSTRGDPPSQMQMAKSSASLHQNTLGSVSLRNVWLAVTETKRAFPIHTATQGSKQQRSALSGHFSTRRETHFRAGVWRGAYAQTFT